MKKYYSENIEKDTKYRADYVQGIEKYLWNEKSKIDKIRSQFISPEKYKKNIKDYRERFISLLGFPLTQKKEMPLVEKTFVVKDENVNIYRMQFEFWGVLKVYGMYFEQCKNTIDTPLIFGFHGGQGTPELISSIHMESSNYNHLIRRMTDRGANVFVPQFLLWGVDTYGNNFSRQNIDGKLRQLGGSVTAMELYFLQCILDYFVEIGNINAEKIGVAGLSYGGMYAIHFAAIEPRVKVCYSCSWVNNSFVSSWADWSYYDAQKYFTTLETMALIAPRALVVAMGDKDELFDYKRTIEECEKLKPYYAEFSCENNFKYVIFHGGHEIDKSEIELDFLFEKINKK